MNITGQSASRTDGVNAPRVGHCWRTTQAVYGNQSSDSRVDRKKEMTSQEKSVLSHIKYSV